MEIVQCAFCDKHFYKEGKRVNEAIKYGWNIFCSNACQSAYKTKRILVKCARCGKKTKNPKFCSSRCSASFNTKGRILSQEHKKNISGGLKSFYKRRGTRSNVRLQCSVCEAAITKKSKSGLCKNCCKKTHAYRSGVSIRQKSRAEQGLHVGWISRTQRSYAEKFVSRFLDTVGASGKYETEKVVTKKSLGLNDASCYFLDFYFPEKSIDLEIDGKQHKLDDRKAKDAERDNILSTNGFIVHRIDVKLGSRANERIFLDNLSKFIKMYDIV